RMEDPMTALRFAVACCCLAVTVTAVSAQAEKGKIDKNKLPGTWTFVKTTSKDAPPPGTTMTIEFAKDGKMTIAVGYKGKSQKSSGTYSVKGDQLMTVQKGPDGKEKVDTVTITMLTDKKFVTREKEDGKMITTEFKK